MVINSNSSRVMSISCSCFEVKENFLEVVNIIHTSYATLSRGIPWNISQVTCIFQYTRKPLGEFVYQETSSDEIFHGISQKGLHNYFISCHRKYSGQMGRLNIIQLNCTDRWEGLMEY